MNREVYQELIDFLIGKPRASIVRIPRETFNKIKAAYMDGYDDCNCMYESMMNIKGEK